MDGHEPNPRRMSGAGSPRAAVADAEAIYSFEGTREISSLIVGRALTGIPAFV